jgi:DNA-binding transcriptional LysR family regulator
VGKPNENLLQFAFGIEWHSLMHPKDVAAVTAFVNVAEQHSFRAAASRLGVTPSAISHAMRKLEERLGVRLLNRTTRSVSLTDAGIRLLDQLRPAFGQIGGALEELKRERERPFGTLKIYATYGAAVVVIAPIWERFLSTYRNVRLELRVDPAPADIVAMGFDAVIGLKEQLATDMVAVRATGPTRIAVVAAPAYLARYGHPRAPEELLSHRCIQYRLGPDQPLVEWSFIRGGRTQRVPVEGRVIINNSDLAIRAAIDGVGIAHIIEALARLYLESGQLVRVLEEFSPSFEGFLLGYPSQRQMSAALRAFLDMVRDTDRSPSAALTNRSLEVLCR